MKFKKFGLDDEDKNEELDAGEKCKPVKRKRRTESPKEIANKVQRKAVKIDNAKRKSKTFDIQESKEELFYLTSKAQRQVRHTFVPSFNVGLNALEDLEDLPKNVYPHCVLSEPRPIYYAKKHCDGLDACFSRTINAEYYKNRIGYARTRYQNTWKSDRRIRKQAKNSVYHALLFKIAERLESNPDPFFYGNYDFYYTGGNLCTLPKFETHNVLHVDDTKLGALKLSTYSSGLNVNSTMLQDSIITKLPGDSEIFEICSLNAINGEQDFLTARQLNSITMLKRNPNESTIESIVEIHTDHAPLISSAQSLENPEMLVVSTMIQGLRVYDISCPERVVLQNLYGMQKKSCTGVVSCWNRIKRWHDKTFLYANEHQLMFIDFRTSQQDWLKTECTYSSKEYACEFNTSLALSEFEHLFYVGSTHKLRCLDARYLTQHKHYEQTTVCEWTHQLDYPPAFLDVHRDETREYVACASPVAGDLRICELTQSQNSVPTKKCAFESHCLPWQPPSLQEAYESASLAGKVWQPETCLKQRIRACTTGISFFKIENNPETQTVLMYANSIGDVYAQTMKRRRKTHHERRITAQSDAVMGEFAKNLCELEQPPLNYTSVVDMKAMRPVFFCTHLNEKRIKHELDDEQQQQQQTIAKDSTFKRTKGRWRKSMSTLKTYKDALVPDLLSIWDIPCEDETDIKYSELKNKFKNEKSENDVLDWLNRNDKVAPTTTIPLSNLNESSMEMDPSGIEIQAQSTQINTSNIELSLLSTSNLLNDSSIRNTSRTTLAKPKAAKTKKKHVKGF